MNTADQPREGELVVEGLLELAVALEPEQESALASWGEAARPLGLELEREGERLQVYGDGATQAQARGGAEARVDALGALLQILPAERRPHAFSTLRVREVRPGEELRTLVVVQPDGRLDARTESVAMPTAPPERPPALWVRALRIALVALAVGALWRLRPQPEAPPSLDLGLQDARMREALVLRGIERDGSGVRLDIERGAAFPADWAELESSLAKTGLPLRERLVLESLARGYAHWEAWNAVSQCLASGEVRIAGLWEQARISVRLPAPPAQSALLLVVP